MAGGGGVTGANDREVGSCRQTTYTTLACRLINSAEDEKETGGGYGTADTCTTTATAMLECSAPFPISHPPPPSPCTK